jgi:hypothetical protein
MAIELVPHSTIEDKIYQGFLYCIQLIGDMDQGDYDGRNMER